MQKQLEAKVAELFSQNLLWHISPEELKVNNIIR